MTLVLSTIAKPNVAREKEVYGDLGEFKEKLPPLVLRMNSKNASRKGNQVPQCDKLGH